MARAADACLIDLDGTVIQGDVAIPGAARAIAALRAARIPFRFTTNTTRHPRSTIVSRLRGQGIEVAVEEVVTPRRRAGSRNVARGGSRCCSLRWGVRSLRVSS